MKKKHNMTMGALAALWLVSAPVSASLVFNLDFGQDGSFDPFWNLNVNQSVWVDVYVSNVPAPGLISMGFDLVYDTSHLQVQGAFIGNNWDFGNIDQTAPSLAGTGGMLLGTQIGDNILLASLELKSIAAGASDLRLFDSDHGGGADDFALENGAVLDGDLAGGVALAAVETPQPVTPPPTVPLPGTLPLLLPGLVGMAAARQRKITLGEKK